MLRIANTLLATALLSSTLHAQVTLSTGVTVPKDRFIVYLVSGNSEAEGQTTVRSNDTLRPIWDDTHPRLWNFNIQDNNNPGPHHTWIPAQGKNHAGSLAQYPDWLGPDMPLLKELVSRYSEEYYFGIIKVANQGDRLRKQYLNNEIGWAEVPEWDQIVAAIAAVGPNTVTWGGYLTVFCDMETHDVRQGYTGADVRLDSLAFDVMELTNRARQLTGSDMPLLFACPPGNYSGCIEDGRRDVWDRLNAQLSIIPTLDPRAVAIPVWVEDTAYVVEHYVDPSNGHYSGAGLARMAEEAVTIIQANGWVPPLGDDLDPPTVPTGLAADAIEPLSVTLSWTASTDDVGVSNYVVYQDGDSVCSVPQATATIDGLSPETAYAFTVRARDYSGRQSGLSAPLTVTTAEPGADMVAPTAPTGLVAASIGLTEVSLSWTAATDNVGVADYIVLCDGLPVDTTASASATLGDLRQETSYAFTVIARDASGNRSLSSSTLTVTTGRPVAFPFRVDVGGDAWSGYVADKAWDGQGHGYTGPDMATAGSGEIAATDDDTAFFALRYGADLGYRVAVPDGLYDITLGFTEYWHPAGSRVFTPFVNGDAMVEAPIDVAAMVGHHAAYLITRRVEATGGLLDVTFTHEGGNGSGEVPILNTLTVEQAPAYVLTAPLAESAYRVGDTMHVRWEANTYLTTGTDILLSIDDGESWHAAVADGTIYASDPRWGDCPIVMPATLDGISTADRQLIVKLSGYNSIHEMQMSGSVTVLPGTSVGRPAASLEAPTPTVRLTNNRCVVSGIGTGCPADLSIHTLNGAMVSRHRFTGDRAIALHDQAGAWGALVAVLRVRGSQHVARLMAR